MTDTSYISQEEKQNALIAAIKGRDMPMICALVEKRGCPVRGPGTYIQIPLNVAAAVGDVDIIKYLIKRDAIPNESTLQNAINNGQLNAVCYFVEELGMSLKVDDYWEALGAKGRRPKHSGLIRYAFQLASDNGFFEDPRRVLPGEPEFMDARREVISAARECLIGIADHDLFSEIIACLSNDGEEDLLIYDNEGVTNFTLMHSAIECCALKKFESIWQIAHKNLFNLARYAELDKFYAKTLVDDLFCSAISSNCDEIFYFLMEYALPDFQRCFAASLISGNTEFFKYLANHVSPDYHYLSEAHSESAAVLASKAGFERSLRLIPAEALGKDTIQLMLEVAGQQGHSHILSYLTMLIH